MSKAKRTVKVGSYTRQVPLQRIRFTCERCGVAVEVDQYPGGKPKYCDKCKVIVKREQVRESQRRRRQKTQG